MNKTLIWIIVIIVVLGGGYYLLSGDRASVGDESGEMMEGDKMEGDAMMAPKAESVVGNWRSTEDSKFTREFRADGTITDMYEGDEEATSNGTWIQVVDPSAEPAQLPAVEGTFIKVVFEGDAEPYYFAISGDTTENMLVLVYVSGPGNILSFERIQ